MKFDLISSNKAEDRSYMSDYPYSIKNKCYAWTKYFHNYWIAGHALCTIRQEFYSNEKWGSLKPFYEIT